MYFKRNHKVQQGLVYVMQCLILVAKDTSSMDTSKVISSRPSAS